jgi:hypothetical protein
VDFVEQARMRIWSAIAVVGLELAVSAFAWSQTGYQYEQLAPDPVLKTPHNLDSMLMRAGYEQRHRDCLDAGRRIDTVLTEKPNWIGAREMRLYCERELDQRVEEMDDASKLIGLQPNNWKRWRDRAVVEIKDAAWQQAIQHLSKAILMRPWEVSLYAMRAQARETLLDYRGAFADYEAIHRLQGEKGEPLKEMARLAVQAGKTKADEERYRELAEIAAPSEPRRDEGLPMDELGTEKLLLYAGYAESLEKRDLEIRFLDAVQRVQYDNVRALEMKAALTRNIGFVSQLIALNPSRSDYFVMRYELHPSLYDASAIVGLEPYEGKSYARRAEFVANRGGLGDPVADYRKAIDLEPGNAEYCYGMSKVYQKRGAFLLQTLALNWALVGEPDNAEWLKERAALP